MNKLSVKCWRRIYGNNIISAVAIKQTEYVIAMRMHKPYESRRKRLSNMQGMARARS
jgi:hypothetical protein